MDPFVKGNPAELKQVRCDIEVDLAVHYNYAAAILDGYPDAE